MSFSFGFSGDDIEEEARVGGEPAQEKAAAPPPPSSAFPVAGKPLLPPAHHDLEHMLSQLPSKVAYSTLGVELDNGESIALPRRELWDVRMQIMAEEDDSGESEPGLGTHDVKTGVYEGGFKSWESSVDLVKVLAQSKTSLISADVAPCVVELGCGTALPSLALFQWAMAAENPAASLSLALADYNATVLQLVTLPNFIISWALQHAATSPVLAEALASDGELDLTEGVVSAFRDFLTARHISLQFFSGAWSPEFVDLVVHSVGVPSSTGPRQKSVLLGAETIYSPFALQSFTDTIFSLMTQQKAHGHSAEALVGAKRLYFGVGGSLDDFIVKARELGAVVDQVREETDGVRRGVVRCALPA